MATPWYAWLVHTLAGVGESMARGTVPPDMATSARSVSCRSAAVATSISRETVARRRTAAGETAMRVRAHAISHPVCTLMSPWRLLVQSGSPAGRPGRKGALLLHAVVAQGQLARATSPWCAAACDTMSVGGRGWTRRSGETHAHMRCRKHAVCDGFAQDTTHTYTRWKKNTQRFSGTAHNLCLFLSCSLNKLS
jgi:hypothetical protein